MIITPRFWGFVCTSAHPQGCAANVREAIAAIGAHGQHKHGPRRVLVIGASSGYGLAARIAAAFGYGAATLGVFKEKPPRGRKTASAGWYHAAAFQQQADAAGLAAVSLNADAFAEPTRARAMDLIRARLGGPVDLVIYSLAAPMRTLPHSGQTVHTVLKPIGQAFRGMTIDTDSDRLAQATLEPASAAEIEATVQVMGGEDWRLWLDALAAHGLLAEGVRSVAFSYLGPQLTWPIYRDGTIGRAKAHLQQTADALCRAHGRDDFARVAVLKSVVTQASVAIPVIPLYLSVVRRVLRETGLEESAIAQQQRLFGQFLYPPDGCPEPVDARNRLRLDDRELSAPVQQACLDLWPRVNDGNLFELTDYAGYKQAFARIYGFGRDDVDYAAPTSTEVAFQPETA